MGTRKIKSEPEIPCATLYLEDIEEIVAAMKSCSRHPEETSVKFAIGDREFDSVEDLKARGGSTSRLEISLVGEYRRVRISRYDTYTSGSDCYDKVLSIFQRNANWWGNSVRSMPGWLSWTLYFYVFLAGALIGTFRKFPRTEGILIAIWVLILLGAGAAYIRHTSVRLRYSHEGGIREWLRRHGQQLMIAVVAAIIGAIIKSVIDRFLR